MAVIHALSFEKAWTGDDFCQWLNDAAYRCFGMFEGPELIGFVVFRCVLDEAEIITIATAPKARKRGIAKALLSQSSTLMKAESLSSIHLEVAAANAAALTLYRSLGAEETGRRKGYYRGEDAVLMRICF